MATKATEHNSNSSTSTSSTTTSLAKKEMVVTPPSNSQPKTSSTKLSTTQGSSSSTRKAPSLSRDKQVPNYLKPTISSSQDSAVPKPTLSRRRSFVNKPPPPSRPQKALSDRTVPVQSCSSSPKPAPKITPRHATKPAQTLYAKNVKKGTEHIVRKEGSSGRSGANSKSITKDNKAREIHDSHEVVKDNDELAKESLVHEVVHNDHSMVVDDDDDHQSELVKVASEDEPETEDKHEHENTNDQDHDHDQDQDQDEIEAKPCDMTIVSEELVNADDIDNSGIEETDHDESETTQEEEEVKPGEQSEVQELLGEDSHNEDESCSNTSCEINHQPEEGIENEGAKVEEVIKEGAEEVVREETKEEEEKERTEEVNSSSKKSIEGDDDDHVEKLVKTEDGEAKPKSEEAVVKRTQGGKKETRVAYNDVIEEAASKLLEKRKTKVKALVGAFETVIDYESAAK